MGVKVVTGKVRFSYAHVWKPRAIREGDTPKYSVSILIDKKDKATLDRIKSAIEEAKKEGASKWGGTIPANLKTPLRDGDTDMPDNEEYKGCYYISLNSTTPPGIVDADRQPIIDESEFYSGCYGRASFNVYPFAHSVKKGVAAGLNNLQKLEEGLRLGGGTTPDEDFGDSEDLF